MTDASTGEPVDGAMVGFPALNLFVLSDEAGNAVLPGIPPGNPGFQVTMLGFGDATASIRLDPGASASGSVALTNSPIAIEGITVSAALVVPQPRGNTITEAELAEPAVAMLTVLDAIQRLRPNWIRSRGETSFRDFGPGGAAAGVPASCGVRGGVQQTSCSAFDETSGRNPRG